MSLTAGPGDETDNDSWDAMMAAGAGVSPTSTIFILIPPVAKARVPRGLDGGRTRRDLGLRDPREEAARRWRKKWRIC